MPSNRVLSRAVPWEGALCGLGAAFLFGLSPPLAKLLLPETSPLLLAGLLYLGGGIGLCAVSLVNPRRSLRPEARLRRSDAPWLAAIIALGGIAGPVLMLHGLERVSGVAGSLLLNLEAPFTVLLAVLLFREHLGFQAAAATFLIVGGAAALAYSPGELRIAAPGVLALAGACLCWAVDNNCTQRLSLRDPLAVARIKALSAGAFTLGLALWNGDSAPTARVVLAALLVGFASYGVSIALDVYALRLLGAAREAAFFATAPFVGAAASIPLLGEHPGPQHLLAAALMGGGAFLLLQERHAHPHAHAPLEHDHAHVHDEHHQHAHPPGPIREPHSHWHRHSPLVHDHPHVPDAHHRHPHT